MSEEEIIKVITYKLNMKDTDVYAPISYEEIRGLLDLYNKEKEKNKELKENLIFRVNYCKILEQELYGGDFELTISEQKEFISKDKIREKIELIKELNEKIYYDENVINLLQELLEE